MEIINISGKDYKMKSSAYTQFAYKNDTGRHMIEDLQMLIDLKDKVNTENLNKENLKALDTITELALRLAYVMIKEADESQVGDYNSFLKSIDDLYSNSKWAEEVVTLASTPILGRLQADKK